MTTSTKPRTAAQAAKNARPVAAKGAKAKPDAQPAPAQPKPLTRTQVIEELHEVGYPKDGPLSFTATDLRLALDWLRAGANPGDESIPNGIRYAVHPNLRPVKTSASGNPARAIARDLRAALKEALASGKDTDAARVVGLAQSLRDTMNGGLTK